MTHHEWNEWLLSCFHNRFGNNAKSSQQNVSFIVIKYHVIRYRAIIFLVLQFRNFAIDSGCLTIGGYNKTCQNWIDLIDLIVKYSKKLGASTKFVVVWSYLSFEVVVMKPNSNTTTADRFCTVYQIIQHRVVVSSPFKPKRDR